MRICVFGLWHLGSVISACLASVGHHVKAIDNEKDLLDSFGCGVPPVSEPGLVDLINRGMETGHLEFEKADENSFSEADVVWVTFDTPVDKNDVADTEFVLHQVREKMKFFRPETIVMISSQLPVGSTKVLEDFAKTFCPELNLSFCCCPENLRLGKAIETFMDADRFIVGLRSETDRSTLRAVFQGICSNVIFMSIESAEMTKHAINGFLATSVVFANELATLCELVGANAKEVEAGLKTEARIGPGSYLAPGPAYSGGTLARDIEFLKTLGVRYGHSLQLISSVCTSNDDHKAWVQRRLINHFGSIDGLVIGVWGLTYKPGTDTLRRSGSVELCDWLIGQRANLAVFDPAITRMPERWRGKAEIYDKAEQVFAVCDALVVATPWPQFKDVNFSLSPKKDVELVVFDPGFHLNLAQRQHVDTYYAVGVSENLGQK